ncbi:MAG: hypothetical protein WC390_10155 [Sulfurimonas sp.]|jgi:hypothetical protein
MPKYYVQSGNVQIVVNRVCEDDACAALAAKWVTSNNLKLGEIIIISERGFDLHDEDIVVGTRDFLQMLGIDYIDLREQNGFPQENEDEPSGSC